MFLVALTMLVLPINAQTSSTFDPFVSRLQGDVKNNVVSLSWVDSQDAKGPVYIYRSVYPFGGTNSLQRGSPVKIAYGVQSYVEEIDTAGTLYYFIAASDEKGLLYDFPIVSKNTITVQAPGALGSQTGIFSLEAAVQGERVIITFNEAGVNSIALYRSTKPISRIADLMDAEIVQTKITSPFIDYPVPGIPYYYAAVDEEEQRKGTATIALGRNTTGIPVEIPAGRPEFYSQGDSRTLPLPLVSVQAAEPGTSPYVETSQPTPEVEPKKPRAFIYDLEVAQPEGDEYALISIVRGPFAARKWDEARIEFVKFIALPGSLETTLRARFYLGQCYYFLKQTREGLTEFLTIRERFPVEAEEWIQALMDMMRG